MDLKSLHAELESSEFRLSLRSSGRTLEGRASMALGCAVGAVEDMIDTEERLLYGLGSLTNDFVLRCMGFASGPGSDQHCEGAPDVNVDAVATVVVIAVALFGSKCLSGSGTTFFFFKE